jgi:hypothetical protein
VFIFGIGLRSVSLDGGVFTKVCIWYRQLRVFYSLHEVLVHIFNLNLLLGGRVVNCLESASFASLGFCVWLDITGTGLTLLSLKSAELLKLSIPVLLVSVKVLNEGLDIGNLILPAVVAARCML